MIWFSLTPILCICICIFIASSASAEVQHVERDGSVLIRSGPDNYALAGPLFANWQWKTVSVNGETVSIWSGADCRTMRTTLGQLGEGARHQIRSSIERLEAAAKSSEWGQQQTSGSQYLSVARPGLPNRLQRVIASNDLVCFVYLDDKRVELKPKDCLSEGEKQLLGQLQKESGQQQLRLEENLQQLRNDMTRNVGSLREMFESMRSNLGKMFSG